MTKSARRGAKATFANLNNLYFKPFFGYSFCKIILTIDNLCGFDIIRKDASGFEFAVVCKKAPRKSVEPAGKGA